MAMITAVMEATAAIMAAVIVARDSVSMILRQPSVVRGAFNIRERAGRRKQSGRLGGESRDLAVFTDPN